MHDYDFAEQPPPIAAVTFRLWWRLWTLRGAVPSAPWGWPRIVAEA